jgi:hypothetical protein
LRRKLLVTIAERARQIQAYEEVSATITREVKDTWTEMIKTFNEDRDQPNPYVISQRGSFFSLTNVNVFEADKLNTEGLTEAQIRLKLRKEEEEDARKSGLPLHGVSATAFLVAGLQLEEAQ